VGGVIYSLARVSNEILEVRFDNMLEIVKIKGHDALEGCSNIFKDGRNFAVCKITQRKNKFHLVLILGFDLNFIIS
jgi:hypothetical protein